MERLPFVLLYEVLYYLPIESFLLVESLNRKMNEKMRNSPYYLRTLIES
jgi:hypothetical protein